MLTLEQIISIAEHNASRKPANDASQERVREVAQNIELKEHGPRYIELSFDVSEAFNQSHQYPAQYITIGIGEHVSPRYIVLANAPGEARWCCLITRDSTLGSAIMDARDALSQVHVSAPEGTGFPLPAVTQPLFLLTTGSGVATMRSVLQWLTHNYPERLEHAYLYYGEYNEQSIAYTECLQRWSGMGMEITMAYDSPLQDDYPWSFVQDPVVQHHSEDQLKEGLFLLSGSKPMLHFASKALLERGVEPMQILLNV